MKKVLTVLAVLALYLAISAFGTWVIMLVLNWILAQFGVAFRLSFLLTWAIIFVCNVLFKGKTVAEK